MNNKTIELLFTTNIQSSVHFVNPNFMAISGPIHITTEFYFIIYETTPKNSPQYCHGLSRAIRLSSIIFTLQSQVLGPIKRPFEASNQPKHHKTLKQSVKPSRIKPLPYEVCRNSFKSKPTRRPYCVERLSFLFRRIPSRIARNLREKSHSLSLKIKTKPSASPFLLSHVFSWLFEGRG